MAKKTVFIKNAPENLPKIHIIQAMAKNIHFLSST